MMLAEATSTALDCLAHSIVNVTRSHLAGVAILNGCHLQEEIARRRERAERFHTSDTLQSYQPAVDPEEAARRKHRAEKFGTEYVPEDAAGLMDVGALALTLSFSSLLIYCRTSLAGFSMCI